MRKRRSILALGICIAAAGAVTLLATRTQEPRYDGKNLSYWVSQYDQISPDPEAHSRAGNAISHIGTNALPLLLARMRQEYRPGKLRRAATSILAQTPSQLVPDSVMEWAREDSKSAAADRAAFAFRALGRTALPAMSELINMMNDPSNPRTAKRAQYALAQIGPEALPVLLETLRNPAASNRVAAALYIGKVPHLTTNAGLAIPVLMHCLKDANPAVQNLCIEALAKARPEPGLVVPALLELLRTSTVPSTRTRVVAAISTFGPSAVAAQPDLITALTDSDPSVRREATNALHLIAPGFLTNGPAQ